MNSRDVPILETLQFVSANIAPTGVRILEIGCGTGELAARLQDQGHQVVAIHSSASTVAAARQLGVDARVAFFPSYEESHFDCVLFTRSLHHVSDLGAALTKAATTINSSGLLLIEDFASDNVTPQSARWFYSLLGLLDACGVLQEAEETFGRRILRSAGDFAVWQEQSQSIHSGHALLQAISENFELQETTRAPYLYRYVSQMVPDDERGAAIVTFALDLEKSSGAMNQELLIGRRYVARVHK